MKKHILEQMDQLHADGIDFVSIPLENQIPTVYRSYTRAEFKDEIIIPKSNYKFYKTINNKKEYIDYN